VAVWEAVGRPARVIWTDQPMPISGRTSPELARLDELLETLIRQDQLPGATVAVARQGRLVFARGFGYSDVEQQEPMQPDSLLRIASISKPITAVAVLQLVDRGSLELSDRVFEIVKSQPHPPDAGVDPRLASITIEQLLQHTGGWDSNQSADPMFQSSSISQALGVDPPARQAEIISYMLGRPLDFDPGTRYGYSNFGYSLLGRVIEAVSGQSYEDYVRQSVLLPVGIERMQLGKTLLADRAEAEARYYTPDDATGPAVVGKLGEPVPLPYGTWYLEAMDAHAGWIASAIDLVRFASAFDDSRQSPLLSQSSINTMFAPPSYVDGQVGSYYGCGWQVRLVGPPGSFNATHVGSLVGTSTILVRRHGGLDWAVLFNSRGQAGDAAPAAKVEGLMHRALSAARDWPEHDLFSEFE
jgi:N-acyl-D-amino-acid deacylase